MAAYLHNALKSHFSNGGTNDITSIRLYNVMADYNAYEAVPASKQVLKEFVIQGYGSKVLDIYTTKLPWQQKMQLWSTEFAGKTGFKEELVNYVFECIEYGLGWIQKEPIYNVTGSTKKDYAEDLTGVDLDKQLVLMQKEYISMLNSLIVVPEGKIYKKSGYYPAQAIADLWVVEHKIGILSAALGKDNSNWCKTEKEKVLRQYEQTSSSQFGSVFAKIILPTLVAIVFFTIGTLYLASLSEIKEYKSAVALGETYLSKGEYTEAITAFSNAANGYSRKFGASNKRKSALSKASDAAMPLFTNAISDVQDLTKGGHYYDARQVLDSLSLLTFDKNMSIKLAKEKEALEAQIENAIVTGKYTMLSSISTNGRKMDKANRETLDELLKVAPDDYWLNFILSKSK